MVIGRHVTEPTGPPGRLGSSGSWLPREGESAVDAFLRARPHYTREHVEHIAAHAASDAMPFCWACLDWHYPDTREVAPLGKQEQRTYDILRGDQRTSAAAHTDDGTAL
jgi:hypothetical protein